MKILISRLFICVVLCLLSVADLQAAAKDPNLIIIYVDDLGYGDLGSYDHPVVQTPNIDQLMSSGIRYTRYYAPSPLCSPSRAAMLTGRTPYRTGIRSWIPEGKDVHLGKNEITIAHLLRDKGYATAVMGKLHLNGGAEMRDHAQPPDMGFDYSFVIPGGWAKNVKVEAATVDGSLRRGLVYPDNYWRNGEPVGETSKFSAELVSDEVINFLEQLEPEQPFFIYIPYSEVHTPVASPQKYLDMYAGYITESGKQYADVYHFDWSKLPYRGSGEYYANISFLDAQIARVLKKLNELGKTDNTIIIFSSDNGPVTREARTPWELGMAGETNGLRGRKGYLFEGGIRVPASISYPGVIPGGQSSDQAVHGVDWLPTLAELMNFSLPDDRELDGQSIAASWQGQKIQRQKPLFWSIDSPGKDIPVNEWAISENGWKLILDRDERPKYLFNIVDDPYEVYNQLGKESDIQQKLYQQFLEYKNSIDTDVVLRSEDQALQ
jgi:arylsulfatase A-like enzyme